MGFEVGQSGKVEQKRHNTIVAITNSRSYTLILKKSDKRKLKTISKKLGLTKIYIPLTFASLISIGIFEGKIHNSILIDTEYPGYNDLIRRIIREQLTRKGYKNIPQIRFGYVGKTSSSHNLATKVAHKKVKPDRVVALNEILKLILPNKKSGIA